MDSTFIFVVGLAFFLLATQLDAEESLETKRLGGHEWNPIMRDGQRKFTPVRYYILNLLFVALSIVAYTNRWGVGSDPSVATNWQPAVTLFLVGALHIFGYFTNQSKVKQLLWRLANPAADGEVRPPL